MSLVDYVEINLSAGKGGDGVVRWRREKHIPKGGPAGGDGGRGGSVYISGVKNNAALQQYAGKSEMKAGNGEHGGSKSLYGEKGEDLVIVVPFGTQVTNIDTGESWDIVNDEKIKILQGGQGGLGNIHFKSSTNQAPQQQTNGKPGGSGRFSFELRLIADAGLIGLPSAGKSSLLNFLTGARSKTAEYHFTTLEPHLGNLYGYTLADIPGLINGASTGKGLGHKFLRHITRTKMLLHCISLESEDPESDYQIIRNELQNYSPELGDKPEQIIFTKADMVDEEKINKMKSKFPDAWVVSVLDNKLLKSLQDKLIAKLERL